MRALLIVNPSASCVTSACIDRVTRELSAAWELEQARTEWPGHATELARAACRGNDVVFVLSGDGGFNEAVNGMSGQVPIGFLPGGATNVLPRALGLPRDPVECARHLARSHRLRRISLGRATFLPAVDDRIPPATSPTELPPPHPTCSHHPTRHAHTTPPDMLPPPHPHRGHPPGSPTGVTYRGHPPGSPISRRFTFAAGVGLDAELIRAVDRLGRSKGRRPGDLAFVGQLVSILASRRGTLEPAMSVEGYGRCAFAVVANCDPYTFAGPVPVRAAPEARFELGLDLVAPRRLSPLRLPRLAWQVLVRPTHVRSGDIVYLHDFDRAAVACDRPTPLEADGEDLGDVVEVVFEAEREALSVLS